MMQLKVILLSLTTAAALCFTGCDSGQAQMGPKETNVLGIVKSEKESYEYTGATTIAVSTDELYSRKNFSGDKTSLLWGFITLKDY